MATIFDESRATFAKGNLPYPPIPEALQAQLQQFYQYGYSTHPEKPFPTILEVIQEHENGTLQDYVSIAYFERGVNSFTVQYHLVYQRLMLFMEVLIGGGYSDRDRNVALAETRFQHVQELITVLDQTQQFNQMNKDEYIFIRDDLSLTGWLRYDATSGFDGFLQSNWIESTQPITAVIQVFSPNK